MAHRAAPRPTARIVLAAYDAAWADQFARERDALSRTLAPFLNGAIEHVGSTAVPGLCAKPVIDLMAPVASLEAARPCIPRLEAAHGYLYAPHRADVMHWLCKPSVQVRTHHLHLVPRDSVLWAERLAFRDALRRDPQLRAEYAALKTRLAAAHPHDREAYTQAKGPFIRRVLGQQR